MDIKEFHQYSPYYVDAKITGSTLNSYEQFTNRIYSLPKNIQTFFLNSLKTAEFIKDIVIKNNLNSEKGQELTRIIKDLLFTDLYLGNITDEIQNRLNIDDQKARTIAGLIVTELFAPILEDLKKMHLEKFAKSLPKQQTPIENPGVDVRIINLKNG